MDAELPHLGKLAVNISRFASGVRRLNSFWLGSGLKPLLSLSRRTNPPSWSMNTIGLEGNEEISSHRRYTCSGDSMLLSYCRVWQE
jgi:hypothetical protein